MATRWFIMCKPPEDKMGHAQVLQAMEDGVSHHGWILFAWMNWQSFGDDEIEAELERVRSFHYSSGYEYEAVSYEE